MKDVLQVADQYYVLATSVLADLETRVLKQGETFAIFDRYGDIQPVTHKESGIFHSSTRHVSSLTFLIAGEQRPVLLNSNLRDDNGLLKVELTNPDLLLDDIGFLQKGTLHFHREKFLLNGRCHEQISVANFGTETVKLPAQIRIGADFADIFEVRGMKRGERGVKSAWARQGTDLNLVYSGLDEVRRVTSVDLQGVEYEWSGDALRFEIVIGPRSFSRFQLDIRFHSEPEKDEKRTHAEGLAQVLRDHSAGRQKYCKIETSNDQFNSWLRRSTDDLVMLTTHTRLGYDYPYAGIPWFCAPFGRDGIITAMQTLWANPTLARETLRFLATTQARTNDPERDANPGKIVHEIRDGEMANLNEVPFGQYYGSVDSTPLFLALCGLYHQRTGDDETLLNIWPAIEQALKWVDAYGDPDEDGFLEYSSESPRGLVQQGWKDSHDSVFHEDGRPAEGPIALCEVQAYVFLAKYELANVAAAFGKTELAQQLLNDAEQLKARFDEAFWLDDLGTYALALDGDKRPCRVIASNAGQCLFTGIVPPERAQRLARTLLEPTSFCGWGVRTIDARMVRYNPMSYHNGSVWPHDSSLIAWGLARNGLMPEAEKIFDGLYQASTYMDLRRMPEVFCGFDKRSGEAPTLYHHACAPQAWAAGSVYQLLQAVLGLNVDGLEKRVSFIRPKLPRFLKSLRIAGLEVSGARVDLQVDNYGNDVGVQILDRDTDVTVSVEK